MSSAASRLPLAGEGRATTSPWSEKLTTRSLYSLSPFCAASSIRSEIRPGLARWVAGRRRRCYLPLSMPPSPLLALRDARITCGGKSTLLKALGGLIELDAGTRFQQPGTRAAYMPQEPVFDPALTAGAFVAQGLPPGAGESSHLVEAALAAIGMAPERRLVNLSGGEGGRVSLAHALVGVPDILLLDE